MSNASMAVHDVISIEIRPKRQAGTNWGTQDIVFQTRDGGVMTVVSFYGEDYKGVEIVPLLVGTS